jgi:hypothetical protein
MAFMKLNLRNRRTIVTRRTDATFLTLLALTGTAAAGEYDFYARTRYPDGGKRYCVSVNGRELDA